MRNPGHHTMTGPQLPAGPQAAAPPPPLPARTRPQRPGPARLAASRLLDATDQAAAEARATTRHALHQWGLGHLADDAEHIASEIVANAADASRRHAPAGTRAAPITLQITADDSEVTARVWDPDPIPPPAGYTPGTWDEHGRGLLIVAALAHQWGYTPAPNGGKYVHATLRTTPQQDGTP